MLVAVKRADPKPYTKEAVWLCKCDCGNTVDVVAGSLRKGYTKSCGCSKGKFLSDARKIHGLSKSRIYGLWKDMKDRCENKSSISYPLYGAKGISVCEEWHDFSKFAKWSFEHGYSDDLTIDRIDGETGYCPDNCRWVSWSEQQNNRCNNHIITVRGESNTLTRMAEKYNIPLWVVSSRIRNGWDEERAVLTPKRYYPCRKSDAQKVC
jgi:hypothetical protein